MVLLVVSNNGFEKIAEPFVAARFILARDLKQQAFQLIETTESVTRDGVGETGAQHHELVLALILGRASGAAYGVVETAELAARAGIEIAHAADDDVSLVVEIEAVGDQLFEFDLGRAIETALAAGTATAITTPVATAITTITAATATSITTATVTTGATTTTSVTALAGGTVFARRTICLLGRLLFSHLLFPILMSSVGIFGESCPFEGQQTFGA